MKFYIKIEELNDFKSVNSKLNINDINILHVNIRSLNSNFENLEILLRKLLIAPSIIICSETWFLPCPQYYELENYILYYNNSTVNKADGSVIFVGKSLTHDMSIDDISNTKFLNTTIKLKDKNLKITSTYR